MSEPLDALRAAVAQAGLDGYVVPRADEHLGEYVAPSSERLAFVSGFTGSAGTAIVTADRAALFTDGRYMIQVVDETGPGWEHHHVHEHPPARWLDGLGGKDLRIGYDPRLMASSGLEALRGSWGEPVAVGDNLVDRIWHDRPPPPASPAIEQSEALTGRTGADKRAAIAAAVRDAGGDAVVLSDPASVCWLFNIRGTDLDHTPAVLAHALLLADATATLFLDPDRVSPELRLAFGPAVTVVAPTAIPDALASLAGRRVLVDPKRTPVWFSQVLEGHGATVVGEPDPCLVPKACKTAAERRAVRDAHRHDGAALCRFLRWIELDGIGRTEIEAAERLLAFRLETGACRGASFDSISAAGANAALMHYHPKPATAATLQAGMLYLIDSGGQYDGGTTDVTRTVWLGDAAPPLHLRDTFTRVLQGHIALSVAVFPDGTTGHRLDGLARLALWRAGLDFDHGAGHGLGSFLSVHEWPNAFSARPSTDPVREGMVLTNEPGFYHTGSHGIRLENAMEVVAAAVGDGASRFVRFEALTLAPFDRTMILTELLADTERAWIDLYHANVAATLRPLLDDATAGWLELACRAL